MTHGVASTSGHLADNGGIRGHSAGPVFPFVLYSQGTPDELYHWVLQPNGLRIGPFDQYEQAELVAARLKREGQLPKGSVTIPAPAEPTHHYYTDGDGLNQKWRWRHTIGAGLWSNGEVTEDYGKTWGKSGHTVAEMKGEQRHCVFTHLGHDPQWPAHVTH